MRHKSLARNLANVCKEILGTAQRCVLANRSSRRPGLTMSASPVSDAPLTDARPTTSSRPSTLERSRSPPSSSATLYWGFGILWDDFGTRERAPAVGQSWGAQNHEAVGVFVWV